MQPRTVRSAAKPGTKQWDGQASSKTWKAGVGASENNVSAFLPCKFSWHFMGSIVLPQPLVGKCMRWVGVKCCTGCTEHATTHHTHPHINQSLSVELIQTRFSFLSFEANEPPASPEKESKNKSSCCFQVTAPLIELWHRLVFLYQPMWRCSFITWDKMAPTFSIATRQDLLRHIKEIL